MKPPYCTVQGEETLLKPFWTTLILYKMLFIESNCQINQSPYSNFQWFSVWLVHVRSHRHPFVHWRPLNGLSRPRLLLSGRLGLRSLLVDIRILQRLAGHGGDFAHVDHFGNEEGILKYHVQKQQHLSWKIY